MDVVWKIGNASQVGDWELRMSLRSFVKNYRTPCNYWIIGHIPTWLDTRLVHCVPWPDPYKRCKDANLVHKLLRIAYEETLSDTFVFCSDDQLLLRPSLSTDIANWHQGRIANKARDPKNKWEQRLIHTGRELRRSGKQTMDFECHIPTPIKKEWVPEALRFDFSGKPGMCVHSTVLNAAGVKCSSLWNTDTKVFLGEKVMTAQDTYDAICRHQFASMNNSSVKLSHVVGVVEEVFSEPAPWELDAGTYTRLTKPRKESNLAYASQAVDKTNAPV